MIKVVSLLIAAAILICVSGTASAASKSDASQSLLAAARNDDREAAETALANGAKLEARDENGVTALLIATTEGNADFVE